MAVVERYGRVSIAPRTPRGYRIYWRADGRTCSRSAPTLERAREVALEVAGRMLAAGEATRPDGRFAALVDAATTPALHRWGERYAELVRQQCRTHILPALGDLRCSQLTPGHVAGLLGRMLADGRSPHTVASVRKILRLVAREGIRRGIWDAGRDPILVVPMPAGSRDPEPAPVLPDAVPTDTDVERLLAALRTTRDPRWYRLARLAAGTGARWAELLALRPADFDLTAGTVHVTRSMRQTKSRHVPADPKTRAGRRVVVLDDALAREVRQWCAGLADDALLFAGRGGALRTRSNWARVLNRARHASGYRHSLHSLRHWRAFAWLRAGVPVADVSYMLGHATTAITMRLYVSSDADVVARVRAIVRRAAPLAAVG